MRITRLLAVAGAALLIAGCGGGGGGGTPVNPATTHYEISAAGVVAVGGITYAGGAQAIASAALVAVDPANPQRGAVTLEPAGVAVVIGSFDGGTISNGQVQTARSRHTLYVKDGGIFRVDHDVPAGTVPAGRRVSSIGSAAVCASVGFPALGTHADLAAPEKTWMFARSPGNDGICFNNDDTLQAVRIDAAAGVAPRVLGANLVVRAGIRDTTGAVTGFVATSDTQAFRLDLDFNSTPLFQHGGNFLSQGVEFAPGFPGLWLRQESTSLQAVSLASPATSVAVAPLLLSETVNQVISDGTRVFVLVNDTATSRVLSFAAAPLSAATEVATFNRLTGSISLTPTRVVAATETGVVSFPKAGGAPTPVITLAANELVAFILSFEETVYADVRTPVAGAADRARIDIADSAGGNPLTLADTRLVAAQFRSGFGFASGAQPSIAYVASPANGDSMAGATLRSLDGATRAPLITYGTLPATPAGVMFPVSATLYGDPLLLSYATNTSSDLYLLDSDTSGSLSRVTRLLGAGASVSDAGPRTARGAPTVSGVPRRPLDSR